MADDVSPSQARATRFDIVLRGYDRAQVDAYIEETASVLDDLRTAASEVEASALAVGIDDPAALANELGRIGDEVASVLEAARAAAEGLRKRAKADADTWRTKAEGESTEMLDAAIEQSQSMRASSWNEGTSLLNAAVAEAKMLLAGAQEDALFMRAEAERDALRLTSDARRDKEEALRAARIEADTIVVEARAESDGVLAAAQKQAELAQERARALEDRRSELLAELEATRSSISHLEEEIDSRRQALETPEPLPTFEPERSHHGQDVGSVRIVAPSKAVILKPVDPDELVAEVEAMRSTAAAAAATEAAPESTRPETVAVISPPPAPAVPVEASPQGPETQQADDAAPVVEEHPADTDISADEIGSIFARLKDDTAEQVAVTAERSSIAAEPATTATPNVATEPLVDVAAAVAVQDPEPEAVAEEPSAPAPVEESGATDAGQAAAAARNASLKTVKKALVELQNETLEGLRTDDAWLPPAGFTDVFGDAFGALAKANGADSGPDQARAFATDLEDSVTSAIESARSAGKGERAVAAAASKVFRMWRSDEAERRLNALG